MCDLLKLSLVDFQCSRRFSLRVSSRKERRVAAVTCERADRRGRQGLESNKTRQAERDRKTYVQASSQRTNFEGPEALRPADTHLQPIAVKKLHVRYEKATLSSCPPNLLLHACGSVKFLPLSPPQSWTGLKSVAPRFRRTRIICLCRREDGSLFLICSCFYYQLIVCEDVLALKESVSG